jgi:hypothetical protein
MIAPNIFTESAGKLSFPDCLVTSFQADRSGVEFVTDGVHVDGFGVARKAYIVRCTSEDGISCRRYAEGRWRHLPLDVAGALKDVCEWAVEGETLVFAGFEKHSGQWQEYIVPAFSLTGSSEPAG